MAGTRKDDLWGCIDFHQCSDFSGPSRLARELFIREASANPMTVEEHIRAGSLVEVPGTGYQEDAEPADY